MEFIFSSVLWLLPVTFIPLIFHIINNRKFKTIEFGAIRFVNVLKSDSVKNINLINIFLLLIRMLIILFLILAISRPTLKSSLNSAFYDPTSSIVGVLIDDTYSNFSKDIHDEQAKRFNNLLASIIKEYSPSTNLRIVSANKNLVYDGLIEKFNINDLQLIHNYQASYLVDLIEEYFDESKQIYENGDLYIFSDLDADFFKGIDQIEWWNTTFFNTFNEKKRPVIKSITTDNRVILPNEPFTVKVDVYSSNPYESINAYLYLDDMKLVKNVSLYKGMNSIEFNGLFESRGDFNIVAELEIEESIISDKYYSRLKILPEIKACLCDIYDAGLRNFLTLAVNSISEDKVVSLQNCNSNYSNLMKYDVVFSEIPNNDSGLYDFERYVEAGGHLIWFPNTDKNQALIDFSFFDNRLNFSENSIVVTKNDILNKNLFKEVFSGAKESDLFKVNRFLGLPLDESSMIETSRLNSLWNRRFYNEGLIDVVGVSLNLSDSDFPVKASFIPFVYYVLTSKDKRDSEFTSISENPLNATYLKDYKSPIMIIGESGYKEKVRNNSNKVYLGNIKNPGNYVIKYQDMLLKQLVVNTDSTETVFDKLPDDVIIQNFKNVAIFDYTDSFYETVKNRIRGTEVWRVFMLISILLLILESFLAGFFEKRL
ncbi:MAG: hypothetical protein CMG00_02410 [Candidatus Marinimicrobia bacterium]|nr:hypothetical protein [Candidatus Neomarinimicrobiota bacterium]